MNFVDKDHNFEIEVDDKEWEKRLGPTRYFICREAGTERPFTGEYNDHREKGIYYSAATLEPLFDSKDKFESGCGWPSFTKPITEDAVVYREDRSHGMHRIEVLDAKSGSHLGHVFNDGPEPTGLRYCINSAALIFVKEGESKPEFTPF
ncbi:peptide-methionine (R)-S-oxide reductase MsrB [Mangrovivirga sp. M17]|uniref:Peptide methionine sulfoxide reductase MsrB n=1 Tax=Mangrovivirga halotolerans TaxID=2993936 RepID=A0ABT3RQT8_9BACT|nr:peptide-methionine (R)-S-oxide reductase MsrB [Mangrovivirga halotolerans]MCX2744001.1 peptide-methionine (R)-S-oxide reductase MsrB [Mangrovivirga halotolerans]